MENRVRPILDGFPLRCFGDSGCATFGYRFREVGMRSVLLIAVVCGVMACEGSEAEKAPTKTEAEKAPTKTEAQKPQWNADQFAGRSYQSLERMWQGTWVMPFRTVTYNATSRPGDAGKSAIGTHEIWTIEGSTLSRYDGVTTETLTLEVIGPCAVVIKDRGKRTHSYKNFYFDGDTLYLANRGGYRNKGTTFACFHPTVGPQVVTARGNTCHLWTYPLVHQLRGMQRHPAQCAYVTEDGKEYFEVRAKKLVGGKKRLLVSGELLVDPRSSQDSAQKFSSHDAALNALTKR
jgi:hypothetical protein